MTSLYAPSRGLTTRPRTVAPITPPVSRLRLWFRDPAWPLKAVMFGFPIFWLLGLGEFSWPIMAAPMVYQMWRLRRPIKVPPYFGLWLALMAWVLAGGLLIGRAPGRNPDRQRWLHRLGAAARRHGGRDHPAALRRQPDRGRAPEPLDRPDDGLPVRRDRPGRPARRGARQRVVLLAFRAGAAARRAVQLLRASSWCIRASRRCRMCSGTPPRVPRRRSPTPTAGETTCPCC